MNSINDRSRDIGEFKPMPDDDMLICRCEEITKGEIRKAVHDGMWTLTEIRRYLGLFYIFHCLVFKKHYIYAFNDLLFLWVL